MIARSYISALSLAALFLAAAPSALAQDINFACYGLANGAGPTSTVLDQGTTNLCKSNAALGATLMQNPTGYGIAGTMNNKMFQSYTNGGYIVSDTTGNVSMGFFDGNEYNQNQGNVLTSLGAYTRPANVSPLQATAPPPSIPSLGFGLGSEQGIVKAGTISVETTPSGGIFTFDAVDLLDSTGVSYYTITGLATNPADDFTFSGELIIQNCPPPNTTCLYQSITSPYSNVPIDQLDITITAYGLTRLDNIQITQVPEGSEGFAYLLLAGGACFGTMLFLSMNRTRIRDIA